VSPGAVVPGICHVGSPYDLGEAIVKRDEAPYERAPSWGTTWSPIVELRQYALHRGQRDVLISLFDRELVETQEAVGMKVIGQYRVLDDPDTFTWVRGFPDMPRRARALKAFYDGPVWAKHGDAANATMIDSDNVLLLRPARSGSGFLLDPERPPPESTRIPDGIVLATIYYLAERDPTELAATLEADLADAGASLLALFVTETFPNNFPRLPVRENERVVVAFSAFGEQEYDEHLGATTRQAGEGQSRTFGRIERVETLRLQPTARSLRAIPHLAVSKVRK
jgi:hypothetical protein